VIPDDPGPTADLPGIGQVEDVAFVGVVVRLSRAALDASARNDEAAHQWSGRVGGQIKIPIDGLWVVGSIRDIQIEPADRGFMRATVDFLGEGDVGPGETIRNFRRGISRFPRAGDTVHAVSRADLGEIFATGLHPHIEIGTVHPSTDIRAGLFIDELLGRHFALVGSTGSGKSSTMALIIHRIIEAAPHGHVVVLDPHGEYGSAFPETGQVFSVDNLDLPYWLMNFEEHCEVFVTGEGAEGELDKAILGKALLQARRQGTLAAEFAGLTVDSPLPYQLPELIAELNAQVGLLDNSNEVARYIGLKNRIEYVLRDPRYRFMFRGELAGDTMKRFLGRLLRLEDDGRPIAILDLSGVPTDIVGVVVALLSRVVFDHAVWSGDDRRRPVLLICEEAHRYIPAEHVKGANAVRRSLVRIAKEGRKHGVSLGLVTQRPSDLAEGALSQCGTLIAMRLNNEHDQARVRDAMPDTGRSLVDAVPALRRGECIVCGEGVAVPMRVRVDRLADGLRPRSDDPMFTRDWAEAGLLPETLDRTIQRWRSQSEQSGAARPAGPSLLIRK
jgi:DNA helicase HerA-like ATPase